MAHSTAPTGDALAFLQRRVGSFALVAGGLTLAFLAFRAAGEPRVDALLDPSMLTHAGAGLCLMVTWLALRGGTRSTRVIRTVETTGLLLACALFVVMGMYLPVQSRPSTILVMALAVVHLARAIYVPSSARRTGLLAGVTGVVLVIASFLTNRRADLTIFKELSPEISGMSAVQFATLLAVDAAAWWVLFSTLAIAASRVIYGLRKQVGVIRELGQYHIEAELGSGAMGIVYRARHALLRRETAVKLLPPERAGQATLQRFEREVKLTARLRHPNTVTVYDYGRTPEGTFYYAMELLDGATLEQIVSRTGPLPPGRVVRILEQAAGALAEAHELGLVHRDIKPANIMLCNQGGQVDVVKVLDFGLVKDMKSDDAKLTHANSITGTPLYLAPEAVSSPKEVDARSDLYALGAVAYYLLVGDHVFRGESLIEVCSKHLYEAPQPPSARGAGPMPEALEQLVLDCLAKHPADRPRTARELMERLARLDVERWDARRAEAWWRDHGASLRNDRAVVPGMSQTIQVDLDQRGSPST